MASRALVGARHGRIEQHVHVIPFEPYQLQEVAEVEDVTCH